ncbi:hypothetical protein BMS3Abin15_00916 [bacterium BMS3Abin15]|nr:hypothetical protein BMS3Abin15_00916 [bacterium BMS3Abin15]HDH07747.1 hypothetical protein [Candidatus Moranbacteria bacterium]HDZ85437.1 hypothetical protein [Candidatus Moranbacteria bacterium]
MKKDLFQNKKLITTGGVIILCLVLVAFFPRKDVFQGIIVNLTFLLIIPILYIKIILKKKLGNFGLQTGDKKKGIIWAVLSLVVSLLIFYIIYNYTSFSEYYRLPQRIMTDFWFFIFFEVLLIGSITVLYEFFFRGFVMFNFTEKFGYWAVIAQFLLFILFLLATGNLGWSIIPIIISAPFAGITAYKSRSLIYSLGVSLFFVIISDALVIGLSR